MRTMRWRLWYLQSKRAWESKGMANRRKNHLMRALAVSLALVISIPCVVFGAPEETPAVPTGHPIETNSLAGWPHGPEIESDTACMLDAQTGVVLYNKGMMEKMYPASTTKIMTALIAIENSTMDEIVTFTETGVAEAYSGSSNLYTQVGEQFTMEDCLYALLMKSANDFASQIAEHVGGSVANFTQMMNDRAKGLGCNNTHFNNAHGLPDENHYTCAYDMALIMREAAKNETLCKITSAQNYVIAATPLTAERVISSHNAMIMPTDLYYEGCLGGKTGYTDASMYTLVSFAAGQDGRQVVTSTMHAPTSAQSFVDTKALFEYGLGNFMNQVVEEGPQVYSGGSVVLPTTATAADVVKTMGDTFETDFGVMINENFTYQGYPVGTAAITKASYDEANATPTPAQEERPAGDTDTAGGKKSQAKGWEPGLFTYLLISVLGVLVLTGVVLIVVTVVVNRKRKKKKRR